MKINKNNIIFFISGLVIGIFAVVATNTISIKKDREIDSLKTQIYLLEKGIKVDTLKVEK